MDDCDVIESIDVEGERSERDARLSDCCGNSYLKKRVD